MPSNGSSCPENTNSSQEANQAAVLEISGTPKVASGWNAVFKYIEDKIIASLLFLAAAPFLGLIAVAIKLDSPGPVLFRQPRNGLNDRVFRIYKFRTMHHSGSVGDAKQAQREDPRVTFVGKFLRRTSLDELPQLLNVLEGNMSLVGPRPQPVALNEEYKGLVSNFSVRHRVKPGITGWAQICGLRGEISGPEKVKALVEHDIYYIENWSLTLDFKILAKTALCSIMHENAC